ncbi:MAG: winged helix-turn-helix transcriptional regulator [Acidilobus sp.]
MSALFDIMRKAFSIFTERPETAGVPDQSEGINYDDIIAQLTMAKSEVERVKLKLLSEMNEYYERLVNAIKSKDEETAAFSASELAIKKKVFKVVAAYEKLLGAAVERIADARNIEAIVKLLAPLQYVMDTVNNYLSSLAPDVTASLTSVIESTEGIIRKVHLISSVLPEGKSVALLDPEVKELMAKAMKEAGEEAERVAPRVPATYDSEVLERKLIDYIRASSGVISIRQAAQALGVSPEVVRELLTRLEAKGLIKVEPMASASRG